MFSSCKERCVSTTKEVSSHKEHTLEDYDIAAKKISNYVSAQRWLNYFMNEVATKAGKSFKSAYESREGDCFEYAICSMGLLKDDGYPTTMLIFKQGHTLHGVHVFSIDGKLGINGNTPLPANYESLRELIVDYEMLYKKKVNKFGIIDVNKMFGESWYSSNNPLKISYQNLQDYLKPVESLRTK